MEIGLYLILGLITGTVSGLIGIGGGVLLTPALVYLFGFTQHSAQGTTLALLVPPVSLLAAWTYYQEGDVNIKVAGLIFLGFFNQETMLIIIFIIVWVIFFRGLHM